jgi:hypothetical protein
LDYSPICVHLCSSVVPTPFGPVQSALSAPITAFLIAKFRNQKHT